MNFLAAVLIFKITISIVFLVLPLLFAPAVRLAPVFGIGETGGLAIFRLYGVAITALLVGYGYGLASALSGDFPSGPVMMGIVSNTGAAAILAYYSLGKRFSSTSPRSTT